MRLVEHVSYGASTPSREERKRLTGNKLARLFNAEAHTIVIDGVPDAKELQDAAVRLVRGYPARSYLITIGVARVHPKDDFVRKIGMKVATSNMLLFSATLEGYTFYDREMRVKFAVSYDEKHVGDFFIKVADGKRPVLDGYSSPSHFAIREPKTET